MPNLNSNSMMELNTLHPELRTLLLESIKHINFIITEGARSKDRQEELFKAGKSKTMNSKHLSYPSEAVDIAPYPYPDLNNPETRVKGLNQCYFLIGVIKGIATQLNIDITIGADWDGDGETRDETFIDVWHIQLVKKAYEY